MEPTQNVLDELISAIEDDVDTTVSNQWSTLGAVGPTALGAVGANAAVWSVDGTTSISGPYWTTGTLTLGNASPSYTFANTTWAQNTVNITNNGIEMSRDADIMIDGQSLLARIQRIEQRLALINRDQDLEQSWPQLLEAAETYQKVLQEVSAKQAVWDRLNQPLPKASK